MGAELALLTLMHICSDGQPVSPLPVAICLLSSLQGPSSDPDAAKHRGTIIPLLLEHVEVAKELLGLSVISALL